MIGSGQHPEVKNIITSILSIFEFTNPGTL